ncbi:hypothetical protein Peur_018625 [Populus x canadensis]
MLFSRIFLKCKYNLLCTLADFDNSIIDKFSAGDWLVGLSINELVLRAFCWELDLHTDLFYSLELPLTIMLLCVGINHVPPLEASLFRLQHSLI